jgi:hypothetical protein
MLHRRTASGPALVESVEGFHSAQSDRWVAAPLSWPILSPHPIAGEDDRGIF